MMMKYFKYLKNISGFWILPKDGSLVVRQIERNNKLGKNFIIIKHLDVSGFRAFTCSCSQAR
jgi:hypothetical protein